MHPLFSITPDDILRLDDLQSRELIARLCRAELGKHGVSQSAVTWGGDQRAQDGGVDARVDVEPAVGLTGYLKADRAAFQVKAEAFGPAKIPNEMAPKGIIRPAINDLASCNGAYIIASTRDRLSDKSLISRVTAMNDCLTTHGLAKKVIVDFYDCRRIADWVEQHPAIVVWLREAIRNPILGWKPYAPWAYLETDINAEYLLDEQVKVFVPDADEGSDVLTALDRLRRDLSRNASVRIVGLSGVGKTRLVQALFDDRIITHHPVLDAGNVLYTDLASGPTPQPELMIERLLSEGSNCAVVIDNCSQEVHQRLTELVKRPVSKIRLLTVEYDIRDDMPEGTLCYRLEGASDEVIKMLLQRRYPVLANTDVERIVEFSAGNARLAFALASTAASTGELARLRDDELFRRLFIQRNQENDELLRAARVASLLYSFDVEDVAPTSELSILADLAEMSLTRFARNVMELQRRGLVQERGKWRAVLPHAISNRLASQGIEELPIQLLMGALVDNASARVARSFSRRVGYLHESSVVQKLVRGWLAVGARYGDLTRFEAADLPIYTNIAPVSPASALAALERAVVYEEFVSAQNTSRAHYAKLGRLLAYEQSLFDRAVDVLLRFALAETPNNQVDSALDVLKSLFYCHLSGTEASATQRSIFVERLINSGSKPERTIGFRLLDAALEAGHFSCVYGFEFGARKRGYGWYPRTQDDVRSWYSPFIEMAANVGTQISSQGREARKILGGSLRALWMHAGMTKELVVAADKLSTNGWPEGWLGVRRALRWDREGLGAESLQALKDLEIVLAPRDLKASVMAKILSRGFGDEIEDDGVASYEKAVVEAERLGREAGQRDESLSELLPLLLDGKATGNLWAFGNGVGQKLNDPYALILKAEILVREAEPGAISIIFLRGLISGWAKDRPAEVEAFLCDALRHTVWSQWFPELQLQITLDDARFGRILESIKLGLAPLWQYKYMGMGRATDPLSVDQISVLVDSLHTKSEYGAAVALDILTMVVHCAGTKENSYRSDLGTYCRAYLSRLSWPEIKRSHGTTEYEIGQIIRFALKTSAGFGEVVSIVENLVAYERMQVRTYSSGAGKFLAPFFECYPREMLDAIYVADEDGRYLVSIQVVAGIERAGRETAISGVQTDVLIDWCKVSPIDRLMFAASTCRLFDDGNGDSVLPSQIRLSDAAIRIFSLAERKQEVIRLLIRRFMPMSWTGSRSAVLAERLPILKVLSIDGDPTSQAAVTFGEALLREQIELYAERDDATERMRTTSFE